MSWRGIGVSAGIAVGRVFVVEAQRITAPRLPIRPEDVDREIGRFHRALEQARGDIQQLARRLQEDGQEEQANILEAQLLMTRDESLVGETEAAVRSENLNVEWALSEVLARLRTRFAAIEDETLRERIKDVEDIVARIQRALGGIEWTLPSPDAEYILVAHDLTPSEAAQLDPRFVRGIALEAGGRTSHTGIIAKSLEIPAVVGLGRRLSEVHSGDILIVDGNEGEVQLRPSRTLIREYLNKKKAQQRHEQELLKDRDLPAITADGQHIFVQANLDFPAELEASIRYGAEGIGLFRSEFLYLDAQRTGLPSEEEQYEVYRRLAERVYPRSAIVRTIDFGGGKVRPFGESDDPERNPIMGLRAIRYCLRHRAIFRTQLRALLRGSAHGRLKIMLPLITSVTELRVARSILEEVKGELREEGRAFNEQVNLGIMIEVPAAAVIADLLAREVDFFSIGTNDLIQFFLAIDRDNTDVSYLYEPAHPGVLRTIKFVVEAAHRNGIRVGMCGEMATEPAYVLLLLGLGLDELSMNPASIPLVKRIIRAIDRREAVAIAEHALQLPTAQDVEEYVLERLVSRFPHGYL